MHAASGGSRCQRPLNPDPLGSVSPTSVCFRACPGSPQEGPARSAAVRSTSGHGGPPPSINRGCSFGAERENGSAGCGNRTLAAKYRADGLDWHRFGRLRAETRIWLSFADRYASMPGAFPSRSNRSVSRLARRSSSIMAAIGETVSRSMPVVHHRAR